MIGQIHRAHRAAALASLATLAAPAMAGVVEFNFAAVGNSYSAFLGSDDPLVGKEIVAARIYLTVESFDGSDAASEYVDAADVNADGAVVTADYVKAGSYKLRINGVEYEAEASLRDVNPQGRFIQPEEIAETVFWLGSDSNTRMTGQIIAVAGGEDYRRLDTLLHLTIAELAGIPSLVPLVADNRARVNAWLDTFPLLPRNIEHSTAQHAAIVSAILAGRPDAAQAAMRDHLAGSEALLRGFLA